MTETFEIRRTGNVLEIINGLKLLPLLNDRLHYWHKTFYRGLMLRKREKWLADQKEYKMLGKPYDPRIDQPASPQHGGFNPMFDVERVPMFHPAGENLAVPAGFKHRITTILNQMGVPWTYSDLRSRKLPPADFTRLSEILGEDGTPFGRGGGMNFRYRQDECLMVIDSSEGCVIGCPTGYGKSEMAARICKVYPKSRILFTSPGLDTIQGLEGRLHRMGMYDVGVCGGGKYNPNMRITLASADSLHKVHLERMDLVLYDEVHTCSEKYQKQLSRFTEAKMIGFSANFPGRSDGQDDVIEGLFGPLGIKISYQEAVEHNVVTPIRVLMVEIPPFKDYKNDKTGEAWERRAIWRNDVRNQVIAHAIKELVPQQIVDPDPQMLAMVKTIDHAFELRKFLPDFTLVYKEPGDKEQWQKRIAAFENRGLWLPDDEAPSDKARMELRQKFETGDLKRAISTYVWRAGVNFVQLPVFVWAAGGDSEISNTQGPGRLSRLYDGKEFGLLIDILDRFDPKAEKQSLGRMADYRRHGWQVQVVTAQIQPASE